MSNWTVFRYLREGSDDFMNTEDYSFRVDFEIEQLTLSIFRFTIFFGKNDRSFSMRL